MIESLDSIEYGLNPILWNFFLWLKNKVWMEKNRKYEYNKSIRRGSIKDLI